MGCKLQPTLTSLFVEQPICEIIVWENSDAYAHILTPVLKVDFKIKDTRGLVLITIFPKSINIFHKLSMCTSMVLPAMLQVLVVSAFPTLCIYKNKIMRKNVVGQKLNSWYASSSKLLIIGIVSLTSFLLFQLLIRGWRNWTHYFTQCFVLIQQIKHSDGMGRDNWITKNECCVLSYQARYLTIPNCIVSCANNNDISNHWHV